MAGAPVPGPRDLLDLNAGGTFEVDFDDVAGTDLLASLQGDLTVDLHQFVKNEHLRHATGRGDADNLQQGVQFDEIAS